MDLSYAFSYLKNLSMDAIKIKVKSKLVAI